MLLKIEIFPAPTAAGNTSHHESAAGVPQSLTPFETHYASLSCSTHDKNAGQGRLWSLGRKQGDACIGADRSVSREHVVLSVATANKTLLDHTTSSGTKPAPCTTPAQVEACKEDLDQMCVLLQNVGKLGSFLVEEEPDRLHDNTKKQVNNDADDDSATANSEEVSQSQNIVATNDIPLSYVTQHFTQNNQTKVKLRPIALNETIVLTQLSSNIHADEQNICTNISNRKRVIVQCGKLGTTIIITRLHIEVVPCTDVKKHEAVVSLLPWATGCKVTQQLPHLNQSSDSSFPPTTYLIAQQHKAGTRNLEAWSRGIPIVSPDFVTAVTGRSSPAAPWPNPSEYPPAGDGNTFWTQIRPDPCLWSTYTLLIYHDHGGNDLERVILAAGAKCVDFVKRSNENGEAAASLFDDIDRMREIVQEHSNCVAVMDSRKGSQKIVQLFQKQLGVPCLTGKSVAKNLVSQSALLHDTHASKNDGGASDASPSKPHADSSSSCNRSSASNEEPGTSMAAASDATRQGNDSISDNKSSRARADCERTETQASDEEIAALPDDNVEITEANKNQISMSATTLLEEKPKHGAASVDSENDDKDPQHSLRKSKKLKRTELEEADASLNEAEHEPIAVGEPLKGQETYTSSEVPSENRAPPPREGPRQEIITNQDLDGWLTALPQGQKRRQYQRSANEIKEAKGWDTVREAFPTDRVKGLLVAPTNIQPTTVTPTAGPNFKAFCKNKVPKPCDPTAVRMTSVLPRENPKQRDLEKQQEVIAEHQRVADELFRDGGRTSRRR